MDGKTVMIYGLPNTITATEVKEFLEKYVRKGSVVAIKVRQQEDSDATSRTFAVVQFLTSKHVTKIKGRLKYRAFALTVRSAERDIVPEPRTPLFTLESATLHLGCPVSSEEFSVLWRFNSVRVEFGACLRKICFFVSSGNLSYKLELSYDSIWEIKLLRCHRGRRFHKGKKSEKDQKFLLIQVQAAPRIYEVPGQNSGTLYEDARLNYFKDIPDDQWIRTTDFTPSCSIGQSSAFCLQLPSACSLPDIREYFVYYEEVACPLRLLKGSSFSRALDLVPIVEPSPGIEVPYRILFKINHMVQNGTLMGPTLDHKFYNLVSPHSELPINYIERALEDMSYLKSSCLNPATWLQDKYQKFQTSIRVTKSSMISADSGLVYVHRVQVTPSKVYFYGPEINVSNRVIRHFSEDIDNFIRISFVDEDGEKMFSTALSPRSGNENRTAIYQRILSTMRNGICIGDKKFEFLAFSSSQLRENSAWMFASRPGLTAADVREWLGDFRKIRNVAKYAARLGQSFSSSTETLTVYRDEVEVIPDVENSGHVFSDGIGKISPEFATAVAKQCRRATSTPSAFQIRYGGYKGVVAVDPTSSMKLSMRKSMSKYESENNKLDVLAYSKYQPCYLNRQLIILLSTLGVLDDVFESKQTEAVGRLDMILEDPASAREAIEMMSQGETTNILNEMLSCGYKPDAEPFLSMLLQTFRATKLLELRTRSRIFIPKGRSLMGCLDETRTLDYGEVFVQVSLTRNKHIYDDGLSAFGVSELKSGTAVVQGKVIVAKNPCLHPGDIRILQAVDVPNLHHMVDCVVFPQKGKRPHPNECSGSDLDGDIYFVSWDPMLIPPCQDEPMDYTPAKPVILNNDVTIEEVQEYFVNYMLNDSLGVISNAHTVFADKQPLKARSEECLELARLFSIAVDFPKTGVPAEIPPNLHVKEYPDFMEKLDKATYISEGVIGKLFREIKDRDPNSCLIKAFTKEAAEQCYDKDMEVDGFKEHINEASFLKNEYDTKLGNLMDYYEIKTEGEILSGSIMKASKSFNRYKDGEAVMLALRSLRKEARGWFDEKSHDHGEDEDYAFAKASAWYHVTYHPDYWGIYNEGLKRPHFLSFPWCVYDKLIMIKQKNMRRRAVEVLQCRMNNGLNLL